jgi:hypothetical protein
MIKGIPGQWAIGVLLGRPGQQSANAASTLKVAA